MIDYLFWWSILSAVLNVILLVFSVWQLFEARSQKEKAKAQIKVWMQDANGLSESLGKIIKDIENNKYSSTTDIRNAIWAIQSCASATYQSLYEERCITEKEYKERQKKIADLTERQLNEQMVLGKKIEK